MTQATTHNTTTPRRAHPAVVRAALRSHNRLDVDARGLNTAVTRDQWNNITKTVYPDGSVTSSQYEPGYSNVTKTTDENGHITQHNYDANGNLLKTTEAVGTPEQRTTDYIVDASGQRISMTRRGKQNGPGSN